MATRTVVRALLLGLLLAVAAGAGYYVGNTTHARSPGEVASSTLSILAAGTLGGSLFPSLADALVNETPGVAAPSAAQLYTGSLSVVHAIAQEGAVADVAAVADFRLVPQQLEPTFASYEVVFAGTPEVLVYDTGLAAFAGVNSSNWAEKLLAATHGAGAVPLAVWNASTDPNGYNEIFSLELEGELANGSASALYSQFYSGAVGALAVPNPSTTRVALESTAASLVSTGVVCAAITYRAYAVANHLAYVALDPVVGLEATDPAALGDYANVSTEIVVPGGGLATVHAAPVLFAATVPSDATNRSLGVAFLHLLLSPQGDAILADGGAFDPIFPGWTDSIASVDPLLAPDLVPLPSWATADLA